MQSEDKYDRRFSTDLVTMGSLRWNRTGEMNGTTIAGSTSTRLWALISVTEIDNRYKHQSKNDLFQEKLKVDRSSTI